MKVLDRANVLCQTLPDLFCKTIVKVKVLDSANVLCKTLPDLY